MSVKTSAVIPELLKTKKISALPVSEKVISDYRDEKLKNIIDGAGVKIERDFASLCAEFEEKFNNKKWIYLNHVGQNEGVYYVNDIVGLVPDLAVHKCAAGYSYHNLSSDYVQSNSLVFSGFQGVIPNENEVRNIFFSSVSYFRDYTDNGRIRVCGNTHSGVTYYNGNYRYMWINNGNTNGRTGPYNSSDQSYFWVIPIFRFNVAYNSAAQIIFLWLANNLFPKDNEFKTADTRNIYKWLREKKDFLKMNGLSVTLKNKEKIFNEVKAGKTFEFLPALNFMNEKSVSDENFEKNLREELLNCDYNRAVLDKYDENILIDPNRGHWDIWDLPTENSPQIELKEKIYARNPVIDINQSGIVGIDFGTKSTVVVYENERGEIIPLQVGKGDYSKGNIAENYENPTILEFIDIEKFMTDYNSREGRPKTSWNDVTVSHTAQNNLADETDSSLFASFFANLKQWCGNIQYTAKIVDHKKTEIDLSPFSDISKGEFNPLEIYAYYLGAYINHMLQPNHIFMKYILSFPVMYERNIRERMLRSFSAGIKKSLPTALLSNAEAMQKFQVVEGASEPAAYAITALEGFGFLNGEENSDIYYSVFDFGGGTTDFDYGVLKIAEGDDADFYDYVLTHFGAHGDRTLGGENLLKLLAFHIFKANKESLLKPRENSNAKIPFTWAAEKLEFAGSEALVKISQEANLNMYNLMQKLRPIWENPDSEDAKKIFNSGIIKTKVFDDAGKEIPDFELKTGAKKSVPNNIPAQNIDNSKIPEKVINRAWTNNYSAIQTLETFAARGNKKAIDELNALANSDYSYAIGALDRLQNIKIPDLKNISVSAGKSIAPTVDIEKILADRIRRGIESFFISLRDAFDKVSGGADNGVMALSDIEEIKIFLAGNSTKSPLVKKIFEEYTDYDNGKARKLLGFGTGQNMPRFILYPPLGTDEANIIQLENNIEIDEKNFARPTGKTGVAFGLLKSRDGSAIRVVDITPEGKDKKQVPFQYYVGRQKMGKFKVIIDKSAPLNQWYRFIGAKLGVFDLLYTNDSTAATNNAPASIAKRLTIEIDADADASVYVMAVDSNTIRYAVSKDIPTAEVEGTPITLN